MKSCTLPTAFVKPWTLLLSLCALLLSGIDAQRPAIALNAYDQNNAVTSCPAGLLEGTDSFVMTGSVNTTGVTITDYLSSLTVQTRLPSAAHFSDVLCTFTLSGCDPTPQVNECYCSGQNSNVYDFVINKTVDFVHSNNSIRVQWEANVLSNTAVSAPENLTTFYQAAEVVYAGANDNQNTTISTSGQCTISQSSSTTFCALNLQAPFTITFTQEGETPLSSTSSCLTADVTEAAVNISYAESTGCERSQVISCAVGNGVTLTTIDPTSKGDTSTESPTPSSPAASGDGSAGCNTGCVIGIAVAVPVFLIVLIVSILYTLHIKKKITLPCCGNKPTPVIENNKTSNGDPSGDHPAKNEEKFIMKEPNNKLPPIKEMSKPRSPAYLQSNAPIINPGNELPPAEDGTREVQRKKKKTKRRMMSNGTPAERNDEEMIQRGDGGGERDTIEGRLLRQSPRPLPSRGSADLEAHNTSVTDLHRLKTNFTTHGNQGLDKARPTSIEVTRGPGQNSVPGRPLPVRM